MSEKLLSFAIFGALVLGYPLGLMLSKFAANHRVLGRIGALAGVVMIFVGTLGAGDIRFLILAEVGFYLAIVWFVASFKFRRTYKAQYQELFAARREPNLLPNSARVSVARAAAQAVRHS
jgi:hypothetical protein